MRPVRGRMKEIQVRVEMVEILGDEIGWGRMVPTDPWGLEPVWHI